MRVGNARGVVVALCAGLALFPAGCTKTPQAAPPVRVTFSIPFAGGPWESIGRALAAEYSRTIPNLTADVIGSENLESQVDAMQAGTVDVALEDAETAYLAFSRGTEQQTVPHERHGVRQLGVRSDYEPGEQHAHGSGDCSLSVLRAGRQGWQGLAGQAGKDLLNTLWGAADLVVRAPICFGQSRSETCLEPKAQRSPKPVSMPIA